MTFIRRLCCLFLVCLACYSGYTQDGQHVIDSLENALGKAETDTAKAAIMQSLSDDWKLRDSAKAMQYARRSLDIYTEYRDSMGMALGHYFIGNVYLEYRRFEKAEKELMTAAKMLRDVPGKTSLRYRARVWHNYAILQQRTDNTRKYLDIILKQVVPLLEKAQDSITLGMAYKDAGIAFMNYQEPEKALEYYRKCIGLIKHSTEWEHLARCYIHAARASIFSEKYPDARDFLDKAENVLASRPGSSSWVSFHSINGMYYYYMKEHEKALQAYDKGLELADRINERYDSQNMLMGKYYIYSEQKQYGKAKTALKELYARSSLLPLSQNRLTLLKNLVDLEEKTGNTRSAYERLQEYVKLSDSLHEENTRLQLRELEEKYQDEKKQTQILTLQNQNKTQQLVLQRSRSLTYLLLAGLAILLVLALLFYTRYRSKRRFIRQQEQIHQQKLRQVEQDKQLLGFSAMMEGQELERKRIAGDLHDGLGGMLAGVKIKLSDMAERNASRSSDTDLYKVINQLDNSVEELRRIARHMMPETLLKFGLETALKDLCSSMQTDRSPIEFQAYHLSADITQPVQIMLYRAVQELLTNAVKHAGASHILVQCSQHEHLVMITVEDDGKGFDVNQVRGKKGLGLVNVQNRINHLNGKVDIRSAPGEGTTVQIEVDVAKNNPPGGS